MNSKTESVNSNSDTEALAAFKRMKSLATGLFVLMAIIYIASKFFEQNYHWVSYIRAFSEAAMVGALADWFAVTALFRHPLGLPIPHTAIIPKSKDRIGIGLGSFISRNFLKPEQVAKRLENIDLAGAIANFLKQGDRARKLAHGLAATVPRIFGLLKDGPINQWLQETIKTKLQHMDLATLFADAISLLTRNRNHIPIVDLIIFHADLALVNYEPEFREKVSKNTGWLPKLFSVDDTAANSLLASLRETLSEAKADEKHSLRNSIDEALAHLEHNLRHDIEMRNRIRNWQLDIAAHPTIAQYIADIWENIKSDLTQHNPQRQENITNAIANALDDIADALNSNQELRQAFDERLKAWAVEIAEAQGDNVGKMVADTIKGWDSSTVVTQIESAVGRDLQYIRINGTVIGGLVGLLIHIITSAIFHH